MQRMDVQFSRRRWLEIGGVGLAWTAIFPGCAQATPNRNSQAAPGSAVGPSRADSVLYLDSNENPHGPSEKALQAMRDHFSVASRYAHNVSDLHHALSRHHDVNTGMIEVGYGSSEILKMAVEAFLGPGKNAVVAHPTYEAISRYGSVYGASTIRVPLNDRYEHDMKKMRAAINEQTGLVYVCCPNNPTATITPFQAIREFVASIPSNLPVLIDEAYHHYVDDPAYSTAIPLVKDGKPVIVTRTFSKIYGMAGLRLGYAVGRDDLLSRMSQFKIWLNANTLSIAAGLASLNDEQFVQRNRELNAAARRYVEEQVAKLGLTTIPSQANFLMIKLNREVWPVLRALRSRSVLAGRPFPPLTTHMRLTLGKMEEMQRFVVELKAALAG